MDKFHEFRCDVCKKNFSPDSKTISLAFTSESSKVEAYNAFQHLFTYFKNITEKPNGIYLLTKHLCDTRVHGRVCAMISRRFAPVS